MSVNPFKKLMGGNDDLKREAAELVLSRNDQENLCLPLLVLESLYTTSTSSSTNSSLVLVVVGNTSTSTDETKCNMLVVAPGRRPGHLYLPVLLLLLINYIIITSRSEFLVPSW